MKKWESFIKPEKVEFSEGWDDEGDFDAWLSSPAGLDWLEDATGIEIIPDTIKRQERVESFAADVVAENDIGETVIIENQRHQTNHDHLGKLLTYASGLTTDASGCHLVWISEKIHSAHRASLDWLNTHTEDSINFFGLEISLRKFGDNLSPELKVVCSPNDWSRTEKKKATGGLSEIQLSRLKFWEYILNGLTEKGISTFQKRSPSWHSRLNTGAGISGYSWTLEILAREIRVLLYMGGAPQELNEDIFSYIQGYQDEIETAFGGRLKWIPREGSKSKEIRAIKEVEGALDNEDCWEDVADWMADSLERLEAAVKPYLLEAKQDWDQRSSA